MSKRQRQRPDDLPAIFATILFLVLTIGGLVPPLVSAAFAAQEYAQLFNAAASVGTGGLVSMALYWGLTRRLEAHTKATVKTAALESYVDAKREIAWAVLHASIKGGRSDLRGSSDHIDMMLTPTGFKKIFDGGREGHEGFYAFQNEMSDVTPEYGDIVFNLKRIGRASERLIDSGLIHDGELYRFLVRLDSTIQRIERNGAGYDESKLLCSFIWEIFTGWNFVEGDTGGDPILRALERI